MITMTGNGDIEIVNYMIVLHYLKKPCYYCEELMAVDLLLIKYTPQHNNYYQGNNRPNKLRPDRFFVYIMKPVKYAHCLSPSRPR